MIDLYTARARAMRKEEHSGDYQELQVLVFDLCDELEHLRAELPSDRLTRSTAGFLLWFRHA